MQPTTPTQAATNAGSHTPPNTEAAHKANFEANFHALVCQPFQDAYDANNVPLYTQIAQDFAYTIIGEAMELCPKSGQKEDTIIRVFERLQMGIIYNKTENGLAEKTSHHTPFTLRLFFQNNNKREFELKLKLTRSILKNSNGSKAWHNRITRRDVKAPESFMLELDDNQTQLALVPTLKKTDIFKFFFELLYPK